MKKRTLHYLFFAMVAGIGLAGCHADVNLKDVNIDSKLKAKLSLPLGELTTSFANMMGAFGEEAHIRINEDGLLEMTIDEHHEREFHKIELANYAGTTDETVLLPGSLPKISKGVTTPLEFPLTISFNKGMNSDLDNERIDSVVVEKALFTINVSAVGLGITDADIQKVVIRLGSQFRRAEMEKEVTGFTLGNDIPVEIDHFTLVMMKDPTLPPGKENILTPAAAGITLIITLNTGEDVVVSSASGFHFTFNVEMMSYDAVYGYFQPSNQTRDSSSVEVPVKMTGDYPFIIPAKDPEIAMTFTYGVAMPLQAYFYSIRAIHPNDEYTPALWNGSESTTAPLNNMVPLDSPYDTSVKSVVELNKKTTNGAIDRFFEKEVTDMAYKYELQINHGEATAKGIKQFRMTKNTQFVLDFHFKMPFNFKPGLDATYADTIRDVSLQQASLDSIAALAKGYIKDIGPADAALYLLITNEIPVDLLLDLQFLDENDKVLNLSKEPLRNIKVASADMKSLTDITPVNSTAVVGIQTEDFETLSKTRSMRFLMHLGDEKKVNESAFPANKKLTIKVGVTADVQATLDLELGKLTDNNKK